MTERPPSKCISARSYALACSPPRWSHRNPVAPARTSPQEHATSTSPSTRLHIPNASALARVAPTSAAPSPTPHHLPFDLVRPSLPRASSYALRCARASSTRRRRIGSSPSSSYHDAREGNACR
ncbi:hypothetical protein GSI_09830 [Ganoderma sinense ZZ0214-1]|uniref:Uncharacterized protein n=1 Tax=Ganoderma sinense ZZ0214-1 TaxID=1077348 RepID=A0A2G8S2W6_9APHY|nr:hypothetical protein GSI_09830 [Ganoderma sinense ZZ0214-1]